MRMRNCAHTYLEASLNIVTKTENLIQKQEKKNMAGCLFHKSWLWCQIKKKSQGFRLFGMTIVVNLVVSPQTHVKECKFLFWKPRGDKFKTFVVHPLWSCQVSLKLVLWVRLFQQTICKIQLSGT